MFWFSGFTKRDRADLFPNFTQKPYKCVWSVDQVCGDLTPVFRIRSHLPGPEFPHVSKALQHPLRIHGSSCARAPRPCSLQLRGAAQQTAEHPPLQPRASINKTRPACPRAQIHPLRAATFPASLPKHHHQEKRQQRGLDYF